MRLDGDAHELAHTVTVDAARLETVEQELGVMLIHQNSKVGSRLGGGFGTGRLVIVVSGIAILVLISACMLTLFAISVVVGDYNPQMLLASAVSLAGACVLVLALWFRRRIIAASFRGIDRLIQRTAKTLLAQNRRMAPYDSCYRAQAGTWTGEWYKADKTVHQWTLDPSQYQLAILGPSCVGLWTNPRRQRPSLLWIIDPSQHTVLRDQLLQAGVPVIDLPQDNPCSSKIFKQMTE